MKNNNAMEILRNNISKYGKKDLNYKSFIEENILHKGDKLIFLTKVGSYLFGVTFSHLY